MAACDNGTLTLILTLILTSHLTLSQERLRALRVGWWIEGAGASTGADRHALPRLEPYWLAPACTLGTPSTRT